MNSLLSFNFLKTLSYLKPFMITAAAALFAACTQDDFLPSGTGSEQIAFRLAFAGEGAQTRVSTAADFSSAWQTGDEVGLFAVSHASGSPASLAASGNHTDNARLTRGTGEWTNSLVISWPEGGNQLDFYAFYPYQTVSDATGMTFTVQADQSTGTSFNKSDLLLAKAINASPSASPVTLAFSHAMALVQMEISNADATTAVTLQGAKLSVTIDWATAAPSVTATGTAAGIKMFRVSGTNLFRALVAPQTLPAGISFKVSGGGADMFGTEAVTLTQGGVTKLTPPQQVTKTINGIEAVLIPKGTFMMGSPAGEPDRSSNETQHPVTLTRDFYMSKYEVTNAQYAAFLNDKGVGSSGWKADIEGGEPLIRRSNSSSYDWGLNWNTGTSKWEPASGCANRPVIFESWYGAKAFAEWAGGSLPTEAQWEYACRAGTTTAYSYGNTANGNYMWYSGNTSTTHDVGSKLPNPWGLYDMHGNVYEWCLDQWDGSSNNYLSLPVTDPLCTVGSDRVHRGGCYWQNGSAQHCRSAHRRGTNPDNTSRITGIRMVFLP
jgi:formylglycine-generating enzyme required for sulfatase activity